MQPRRFSVDDRGGGIVCVIYSGQRGKVPEYADARGKSPCTGKSRISEPRFRRNEAFQATSGNGRRQTSGSSAETEGNYSMAHEKSQKRVAVAKPVGERVECSGCNGERWRLSVAYDNGKRRLAGITL